ncbi:MULTISPECIES: hypothetical protein [unclassified Caballeronia]|uniref:hypothetical protein n=1 Tax=unclassified Caballeronia TaxID=2646786 RepID=UPI0028591CD4|nr:MULTISPECIES: hypothetical protein [unclassified Caballeronia]MDR5817060.1 hypothetical protein [Caballeronia sp. LZ033]MDR5823967.1 hypothetical protein [Caballeronia sp. LZ043]MDR5881863.1 hypothetical protein [Caballeronia sp. LZ032]
MKVSADQLLVRALCSGSAAGLASASAASTGAVRAGHGASAALNAVTHCLWRDAQRQQTFSIKYTALGAGIHMGSAVFWGVLFEALCPRRAGPVGIVAAAGASALIAYVVDYHVVPKRVTPGFEVHLSKRSLAMTYVALAAGFAIAALVRMPRARPTIG